MTKFAFGRLPSEPDARDYLMSAALPYVDALPEADRAWACDKTLEQGDLPACVGFSCATWSIAAPVQNMRWGNPAGIDIYRRCKRIDGHPGENGTTLRVGAKVMVGLKRFGTYFFARNIDEVEHYVRTRGPVIMGTAWTEGMCRPSLVNAYVRPRGRIVGGHAWLVRGIRDDYFIGRNSWGSDWGNGGDFRIRIRDLRALLNADGEALAATERPLPLGEVA